VPAAPSPRQCERPCPTRTRRPGGGPATSSEAQAPSARARIVRGRCRPRSSPPTWVHSPGRGRSRPVHAMSSRPPGECHGAIGLYGVDQPGDHRKERRTSLSLTSEVVVSFTGTGPTLRCQAIGIRTWPACALLVLPSGCSDCRTRTGGGGLQSWLGVDGVPLLAGGGRRG
jgi:hypothetical protein